LGGSHRRDSIGNKIHIIRGKFGDIAVEMNIADQATIDKALVVQKRIFEKTRVSMPIGQILVEMGAMNPTNATRSCRCKRVRSPARPTPPLAP
jgi:hypothetical protein